MDAKLKQKWVEALRSKRYRQGSGCLKAGRNYCCLGVLSRVAGAKFKIDLDVSSDELPYMKGSRLFSYNENGRATGWLQDGAFGLSTNDQFHLASMNDRGDTFAQIADHIEANIPSDAGAA